AGSVPSRGYCWVVSVGEPSATATCARVGLTGSNGFVAGLQWTPEILADVSSQLGCVDAGDTGCCAQSMWITTATNTCFTDNFSADVVGADFYNWSGQRLPGQFAVDACNCPDADCQSGFTLTALSPAMIWLGLKTSDDIGTKFDLLAEVLKNDTVIASAEADNVVPGSGSGFGAAAMRTIIQPLSSPTVFAAGDRLEFRLSVRIAQAVSGHRSGTARLWFNDAAANSRFETTINGTSTDLFLLNGFVVGTS